jgi:hypothetical protein
VPAVAGGPTPIRHVVLIVRENKTYDSVLGDLGRGNGDRSLVMYGESVTRYLLALARRFTDHDNFYSQGVTSVVALAVKVVLAVKTMVKVVKVVKAATTAAKRNLTKTKTLPKKATNRLTKKPNF